MSSEEKELSLMDAVATATGGHSVYLAARKDDRLGGHLGTTTDGKLTHNGKRLSEEGLSNINVYLTGKYGIRASRWELYSGLVSAAASIPSLPRKPSTSLFTQEYADKVNAWLELNAHVYKRAITTAEVASSVDSEGLVESRRATEMKVAAVLRSLGYGSRRTSISGKRVYKWTKNPT
tara:strand:+ start:256 stop:789 length:534 start_codon:yes stop_codon:yes gene_type:complete